MRATRWLLALALLAGCGGGTDPVSPPNPPPPPPPPPGPAPVATVTLSPVAQPPVPQETRTLTATLKDAQGNTLTGRAVSWSSAAPAVATIDAASGVLSAVTSGTAQITATSEGRSGATTVTVLDGALIGATGGEARAAGGIVTVTVPGQALTTATALSIAPVPNPQPDGRLVPGTAFAFSPSGTAFAQPVTLRIKYPATLPTGFTASRLRIHRLSGTTWTALAGSTVDQATRTVTAQSSSFSTYAVLELPVPPPGPAVAPGTLVAGGAHVCGLTTTGEAWCWGSNTSAQLGNGTFTSSAVPVRAAPGFHFIRLAAAWTFTCGITTTGAVKCWGANTEGVFGDGTAGSPLGSTTIKTYQLPESAVEIFANYGQVCTIVVSGDSYCSSRRHVPGAPAVMLTTPEKVLGGHRFVQVVPGLPRACGLDADGKAWCWGSGPGVGAVNNPDGSPALVQVPVPLASLYDVGVQETFEGGRGTCGLSTGGELWCWGSQAMGQFGDGRNNSIGVRRVGNGMTFSRIATLQSMMCGLSNGEWHCWGKGFLFPDNQIHPIPEPMSFAGSVVTLTGNFQVGCALLAGGAPRCAGVNFQGVLGRGYFDYALVPTPIAAGFNAKVVSVGSGSTCAVSGAGDPWCWGHLNQFTDTPARISTGLGLSTVSVGFAHACGLDAQGKAWCWGRNGRGQLGDGSTTDSDLPIPVNTVLRFTSIAATDEGTCGLAQDQTAWCWGHGNPVSTSTSTPRKISALQFTSLVPGGPTTCGYEATGFWCWDYSNGTPIRELVGTIKSAGFVKVASSIFGTITTSLALRCSVSTVTDAGRNVFCGGDNVGFLGPNPSPMPLMESIVVSEYHACMLEPLGKAWCRGAVANGQLGGPPYTGTSAFVAVATSEMFKSLSTATGANFVATTCGVTMANAVLCWGDGATNRLGRGLPHYTPTLGAVTGGLIVKVTP